MATVGIVFTDVVQVGGSAVYGEATSSETLTSSGTSQASTGSAAGGRSEVATVTTSGGAIWVRVGTSPTAAAGSDYLLPDGATRDFGALSAGEKVAIIDA